MQRDPVAGSSDFSPFSDSSVLVALVLWFQGFASFRKLSLSVGCVPLMLDGLTGYLYPTLNNIEFQSEDISCQFFFQLFFSRTGFLSLRTIDVWGLKNFLLQGGCLVHGRMFTASWPPPITSCR